MKRKIIRIDEEKCNGCAACLPNCPEGAIQILGGKARLISDLFCDGLGACLGHCPTGAITVEEREAEPYSERKVMENIVKQGPQVIQAHLEHLADHGETAYLNEAKAFLKERKIHLPEKPACGCPGSASRQFAPKAAPKAPASVSTESTLTHWPVQMHLLSPDSAHFRGSNLVLAADCVAFALGDFHGTHLKGKTLGICCPKLDAHQQVYIDKLKALIDRAGIHSLTVMIMQVPCCRGLLNLAVQAAAAAERKIPIHCKVVGIEGGILTEETIQP